VCVCQGFQLREELCSADAAAELPTPLIKRRHGPHREHRFHGFFLLADSQREQYVAGAVAQQWMSFLLIWQNILWDVIKCNKFNRRTQKFAFTCFGHYWPPSEGGANIIQGNNLHTCSNISCHKGISTKIINRDWNVDAVEINYACWKQLVKISWTKLEVLLHKQRNITKAFVF
jgi:hypothetical protein